MKTKLVHLLSPKQGGVLDYVDVCLSQDFEASEKLTITKEQVLSIHLPEHCLLHYSGYGFTNRGAPLWLLNKVKTDRARIKNFGVFFHELYAFGPPWGSAFWLSPVQRHIARRLAEMSDFWITNREISAQWLRRFAEDKPHAVMPVFSNVGEWPTYSPARAPKIVVFGSVGLRLATYRAAGDSLILWAREQRLELHDIGPSIDDPVLSAALRGAGVVQHGRLDAAEVSKQFSESTFGVLAYPAHYVAKSGVFAAYCAHGVCPVLISKHYAPADGLVAGTHYFAGLPIGATPDTAIRDIGAAAWNWYKPHNVKAHVDTTKRLLREVGAAC